MIVTAFDLSLAATGWARPGPTRSGVIETEARGTARLLVLRNRIMEHAQGSELVVVEGYSFGSKGRSVYDIGELGGVVRLALYEAGIEVVEIAPSSLKRYATGAGNSPKEAVLAAAIRRLDFQGHDHNEADALWLLMMALDHYELPGAVELPRAHRQALDAVKWPARTRKQSGQTSNLDATAPSADGATDGRESSRSTSAEEIEPEREPCDWCDRVHLGPCEDVDREQEESGELEGWAPEDEPMRDTGGRLPMASDFRRKPKTH